MCKVYTVVGGIKKLYLYYVCPPVRKIIYLLKLVDYLHVQAGNPWYNYFVTQCQLSASGPYGPLFYLLFCTFRTSLFSFANYYAYAFPRAVKGVEI